MRKNVLLIIASVLSLGFATAQTKAVDTVGVKVYYRRGYSTLDRNLRDNETRLKDFGTRLQRFQADTLCRIRNVNISSGASPEGTFSFNERLAEKRASQITSFLRQHTSLGDLQFRTVTVGIDWKGLSRMVEASDMRYKDEVLDIIYNTPEWAYDDAGKSSDARKRRLMTLRGGEPWRYMDKHFFPELRYSAVQIIWDIEPVIVPEEPEPEPQPEPEVVVAPQPKPFYMALKTNLLYDALIVPNIGIEFYLGRNWSIGADWMYAWWKTDRKQWYWRTYGGDLVVRKWLGRRAQEKPLTGHHLGVYGQMFTYDFETGGTGYMGGKPGGTLWDKMNYVVGVEYGYSLPIGRRLNLDFTLGVGYWGGEYYKYKPVDDHYVWQETKQRHWFGPTKAEISLVWLLGRGNYNQKRK